jgi:hypothetical protein
MFVRDGPLTAELAQANRQTKLQLGPLAARLRSSTAHQRGHKRDIIARGNAISVMSKTPASRAQEKNKSQVFL